MISQIIPLLRLPRFKWSKSQVKLLGVFDYLVPYKLEKKIQIGQIVEIPFRNRIVKGVVIRVKKESKLQKNKIQLKAISSIIYPELLLTQNQIELAFWLSKKYWVSPAIVMKMMVPHLPGRQMKLKMKNEKPVPSTVEGLKIKENILIKSKIIKPILFWWSNEKEKIFYYKKLISNTIIKNDQQVLILMPEISNIKVLASELGLKESTYFTWCRELSRTKFLQNYFLILQGKAKIIIGSRSAVFAPFNNLGLIIIDEEHNANYKQQDQNPRYDARDVALKIAKTFGAKILFASYSPGAESYYLAKKKVYQIKSKRQKAISNKQRAEDRRQIEVIDMREEIRKENYSSLSERLQEEIKKYLKIDKQIFLFLNRKGLATTIICPDCGFRFNCPDCKLPLVYHPSQEKDLICHHCSYKEEMPPLCPKCNGPRFRFLGRGTEKIEKEIKKLFPHISLSRIEKETKSQSSKLKAQSSKLIVGTQYAFPFLDWTKIGLLAVISADTGLERPDFKASERTWHLLNLFMLRTKEAKAKFLIQTYNPKNYLLKALEKNESKVFYKEELKVRSDLGYPPYTNLIKLIYQYKKEKKAIKESEQLYRKLLKKKIKNIEILKPVPAYTKKVRGRYRYYIIIKLEANTQGQKAIEQLLKMVPNEWLVDVGPESLF